MENMTNYSKFLQIVHLSHAFSLLRANYHTLRSGIVPRHSGVAIAHAFLAYTGAVQFKWKMFTKNVLKSLLCPKHITTNQQCVIS